MCLFLSRGQQGMIIPTLMYHSIAPEPLDYLRVTCQQFQLHLEHLCDHYSIISLQTILHAKQDNTPLPAQPVLITFDDGLKDGFTYAMPLLEKAGVHAVFFVIPAFLGKDTRWDHKAPTIEPHMTASDVLALHRAGYAIGNHTLTHQRLSKLSVDEMRREFTESHTILTDILSQPPAVFSYPYGDGDERSRQICREMYSFGFATVRQGVFDWDLAPENIRRIYVSPDDSPEQLDGKIQCYMEQRQHE
jgi:peptidoglycan/xylan/chitin deacetylase (PgdA/CDA1 family)